MMKKLIIILLGFFAAVSAMGQAKTSASFGLDPSDREAVERMRARSDSIRAHRPVTALVLSGGGAKGAATIGALKYMERYHLPIDMILGTSVGGLLGGLYALGYDADYLTNLIRNLDWDLMLSDKVDSRFLPRRRIDYNEKFALSFPFYYRKRDRDFEVSDFAHFTDGKLNLSATAVEDATNLISENLLKSLPSGTAYGQNVNQVISSRTVGYSDSTDFLSFPIPFACVSTDLVSGKAKVWHNGNINFALRATMSIPAIYVPARSGNMVLLDGGMRNNFPVDIAKDLGADIVIGIDLSTDDSDINADKINNIIDVVMRSIDMFSNDSYERSIAALDLHIKPDLTGYNMLSFSTEAVEFMLLRGYRAAEKMAPKLDSIRMVIGPEKAKPVTRMPVDIGTRPVLIDSVIITGVGEKDAAFIRSRLYIKDSSIVNARVLEDDVARIFGGGSFDFLTYSVLGKEEPYRLELHCQKGPVHRLGVGFRMDTEEIVSAILNLGLNTNSLRGGSMDITARISTNPYLDLFGRYVFANASSVNARAMLRITDKNAVLFGNNYFNVSFIDAREELFLSNLYKDWEINAGIFNDYQYIRRIMGTAINGDYDPSTQDKHYQGVYMGVKKNTLDSSYFPETGVLYNVRLDGVTRAFSTQENPLFGIFTLNGTLPVTAGRFTMVTQLWARFLFGENLPLLYANVMGGDMAGRYADQQIPFIGLNNATFRRNYLTVGRIDLRYRFGKNHYVSLMGNGSHDFFNFRDFDEGESNWGVGLGYAYNTIVGPLKLNLHYSTITQKLGAYISVGFNF